MDLCGEIVVHKTFGPGKIIGFTNNYVKVLFDDSQAEKEFVYPSAFGEFLVLKNDQYENQIKIDKELIAQKSAGNQRAVIRPMAFPKPPEPKKTRAKPKATASVTAKSPDRDKL